MVKMKRIPIRKSTYSDSEELPSKQYCLIKCALQKDAYSNPYNVGLLESAWLLTTGGRVRIPHVMPAMLVAGELDSGGHHTGASCI